VKVPLLYVTLEFVPPTIIPSGKVFSPLIVLGKVWAGILTLAAEASPQKINNNIKRNVFILTPLLSNS
jgi:hypothetical protein